VSSSSSCDPRRVVAREPNEDETPWVRDFHNPQHELRRLFGEALGTFVLVLVTIGAIMVNVKSLGEVPLAAQVVAPGLAIMAIIYTIGGVSGAHVNPAVTVSYALRRNFPWRRVPGYVAAQLVGGIAAVAFLRVTVGDLGHLGASAPGPGVSGHAAFLIEMVLTVGLVTVTLGTASGQNNVGPNAAIARGGYVAAAGLWAGPMTGAAMNPARSLSAAIVADDWSHLWIYVLAPLAGGAIAVGFAWILRGPPTIAADRSAQGLIKHDPPGDPHPERADQSE
jgi:aquaporin Z